MLGSAYDHMPGSLHEASLLCALVNIQVLLQVVFEDLGAKALAACTAPELALRWQASLRPAALCSQAGAGIVVDAGFSFIHIVPFLENRVRCCCCRHGAVRAAVCCGACWQAE